ncbi:MAG: hypothetical protein IKY94_11765 [Lachnospiraceae bacterium]|nr:hypothetical protein [Lachnospiraceae bacterium]
MRYKILFKEVGGTLTRVTTFTGNKTTKELVDFFGLERQDIERYSIIPEVGGVDLYMVFKEDGVQTIKFLGYYYQSDDGWKYNALCGCSLPLSVLRTELEEDEDFIDNFQSSCKQYIEDNISVDDIIESARAYPLKPLLIEDVTDDTPEGFYIDMME